MNDSKTTSDKPIVAHGKESGGSILGHIWASIGATIVLGIICCGIYPLVIWAIGQTIFPHQANGSLVKKDGTYTTKDEEAVGSSLIGQNFSLPGYFHPRPSAAGAGYDATSSGGTNLGPLSAKLINGTTQPTTLPSTQPGGAPLPGPDGVAFDGIKDRIVHYCIDNDIPFTSNPPIDQFKDKDGNLLDAKMIEAFNNDPPLVFTPDPSAPIPGDAVTASGSGLDPHISPRNAELQAGRVAKARGISKDQVLAVVRQHTDGPDLGFLGDPGVNVLMVNLALDAKYPLPAPPAPAAAPVTQPVTLPTTEPAGK